jgi:hypothetical protein
MLRKCPVIFVGGKDSSVQCFGFPKTQNSDGVDGMKKTNVAQLHHSSACIKAVGLINPILVSDFGCGGAVYTCRYVTTPEFVSKDEPLVHSSSFKALNHVNIAILRPGQGNTRFSRPVNLFHCSIDIMIDPSSSCGELSLWSLIFQ